MVANPPPPPLYRGGGGRVFEIFKKGGSDFSHKNEGMCKTGGVVSK